MKNKLVNIIIPVHNRWEHTKQTLDSLRENTNPELYRLDLVDDKSDPEVSEQLGQYIFNMPTYYDWHFHRQHMNIGPGASRNAITKYITGENLRGKYLYHSDNDVYFTPGWLDALVGIYEASEPEGIRLLGGSCHPYLQNNAKLYNQWQSTFDIGIKDAVSGYSQLMTWETWDTYGPFDETMREQEIKIMGSEDWALCQKIIKAGFKVGSLEPEVVIATGKTNTYGNPATGSETFKEQEGVVIK